MSHKKLVIGNWKMNPATTDEAKTLSQKTRQVAKSLKRTEAVSCPPFVFISACKPKSRSSNYSLGAQSTSAEAGGSHTGQVSAAMLRNVGVDYVIVGHSEERASGVTDALVSRQVASVLEAGLVPVVCVGEKARDDVDGSHFEEIKNQMKNSLDGVSKKAVDSLVLAYEPIWAVGAPAPMAPEQINEMSIFVKKVFADMFGNEFASKVRVLYGGSVNATNAGEIMRIGRVDGLLVGRESLNPAAFGELLKAVDVVSE